ncbi:unnamed protein product [Closterium sp. NIES-54]
MARITGMLALMGIALGATARAFSHAMLQVINDAPSWKSSVVIPPSVAAELHFWLEEFDRFNGAPFHVQNSYDAVIHVDASSHSWGATLTTFPGDLKEASITMSELLRATPSTRREIEGVIWALQTYANKIKKKHVLVRVDNQSVFFILCKGGSCSPDLTTACKSIICTCMELGTRLIIEWIPRELNSHADKLSKMVDHDDYKFKTPWFRILERRLGPHSITLFANSLNTQLSRICTKIPHSEAIAVDAFLIAWTSENNFDFPPPQPVPVMATPSVLTFDAEGRAVDFEFWVDDLQLFLQCDRADGLSLFYLTSGVSPAPPAIANSTVRLQWATHDAAARLAVRRHLPTTERAHFSQYKSAQTLYDAVAARYSSPASAALSHLFLPYLFPDLAAFPTVADLITHLRTSDARYRTALPTDQGPLPLSLPHHTHR